MALCALVGCGKVPAAPAPESASSRPATEAPQEDSAADPAHLYAAALRAYRAGDLDTARRHLDKARALGGETAGFHILTGWVRLRAGAAMDADAAFAAALELEPGAAEPQVGRGYAAMQLGALEKARAWFEKALVRERDHSDARRGLAMALLRLGEAEAAAATLKPLESQISGDAELRDLAARIEAARASPKKEARPRPPRSADEALTVVAHSGLELLEVPGEDGGWAPLFIKGVNLGVALPGKYPSQFPPHEATYLDWLDKIAAMNANVVRLYTLLPPAFYDALLRHNLDNPDRRLWLIQGVWAVLPPEHDFYNSTYQADLQSEVERVIDAFHGNLDLPRRPGHASGRYRSDVSPYTLALILGREWEPYSVLGFNELHPEMRRFAGRFADLDSGSAMEHWVAWLCEIAMAHETDWYRTQRPVAFSNWPTLDPLHHPTEATRAEELAFRRARGEAVDEAPSLIYNDDAVAVDAEKIRPAAANLAGFFASYHVYPYFPDFMNMEPAYLKAVDSQGPSPYFGYLRELKEHHASQPLLVSEFGVPTSRGVAHVQPLGWNHGGHSELRQGELLARMMLDIRESRTAGGIAFAWLDEWFKKNWMYAEFEEPRARNRLWHNVLDPEQNFGILAARAGPVGGSPILDGRSSEWEKLSGVQIERFKAPAESWDPCRTDSPQAHLQLLGMASDPAYLYVLSEIRGADCDQDGTVDWNRLEILLGIDTHEVQTGDRRLRPGDSRRLPTGVEFRVTLAGPGKSFIEVDPAYDVESHLPGGPFVSESNEDGVFIPMKREANRRRFGRDGTEYPSIEVSQSTLSFGVSGESDVAVGTSGTTGIVELRLPWNLLQFTDPSERRVLDHPGSDGPPFATSVTDAIRLHLSLRDADGNETDFQSALPFTWESWQQPSYHLELKQSYDVLREAFAALPDVVESP